MGANWYAPNNKALSSKINQCSRFLVCHILSSSSRRLSGGESSSSFSLSLWEESGGDFTGGRVLNRRVLSSQPSMEVWGLWFDTRRWESWNILSDQLGAVILDSLFHRMSTWSCFYSLIFNSWNLFGNILGFWNGKEKLLRALKAATGTRYLAGSNPKWQPQPSFFTGAFWRI